MYAVDQGPLVPLCPPVVTVVAVARSVGSAGGQLQRIRALAGQPVLISGGIQVESLYRGYPGRGYVGEEFSGGLYATVRLQPDGRVRVEVDSRDVQPRPGAGRIAAEAQGLRTVVSGRLGEWIPLGGVGRSYSGGEDGLLSGGSAGGRSDRPVAIRVDRVD